jgi:hypothetical protein
MEGDDVCTDDVCTKAAWLDYDPVALAVLVIGIGIIGTARIDHLTPDGN